MMGKPLVHILMATRNGGRFIGEQLESIASQTGVKVRLTVSDDGSSDDTCEQVRRFAEQHAKLGVKLVDGPRRGFCRNFLGLACEHADDAPYFAFSDQDDLWDADKLSSAIDALKVVPAGKPAVYFSRTRTVAESGETLGMSPLFIRQPDLRNALVQSIGGGNTTVFNAAARDLLAKAGPDVDVPSHDWWAYLAVTACGGIAIYDPAPHIGYRQHSDNLVGENSSMRARLARIHLLLAGRFERWIDRNLAALSRLEPDMSSANRDLVEEFRKSRRLPSPLARLSAVHRLGLYRQTTFGNLTLYAASLLGKL